jgi:hypothetical protein
MRKLCLAWTTLVAFACGTPGGSGTAAGDKATKPTEPTGAPVPTSTTPVNQTPNVSTAAGRTAKIEAPHGGSISTLAVTPDGASAVSVDDSIGATVTGFAYCAPKPS